MAKTPLEHKDIVRLLGELKDETPEYPMHLMSERKAAFIQKAIDIKISRGDDSNQGGGTTGGKAGSGGAKSSGAALHDKTFFLGLSLKQTITIGAILVLLVVGYFVRDQVTDVLFENEVVNTEEAAPPANSYGLAGTPTDTPTPKPALGASAGDPEEEHSAVEDPASTAKVGNDADQEFGAPTPSARRGPASALRFLFCILSLKGESCE